MCYIHVTPVILCLLGKRSYSTKGCYKYTENVATCVRHAPVLAVTLYQCDIISRILDERHCPHIQGSINPESWRWGHYLAPGYGQCRVPEQSNSQLQRCGSFKNRKHCDAGRDSSVGIATRYGLDGAGDRIPAGEIFSVLVQTGPAAHPASCATGTGSYGWSSPLCLYKLYWLNQLSNTTNLW